MFMVRRVLALEDQQTVSGIKSTLVFHGLGIRRKRSPAKIPLNGSWIPGQEDLLAVGGEPRPSLPHQHNVEAARFLSFRKMIVLS
jgi:hypothetical protein